MFQHICKSLLLSLLLLPSFMKSEFNEDSFKWDNALSISDLCAKKIKTKRLCANKIVAKQEWVEELAAGKICTDYVTTQSLCVGGQLTVGSMETCQKFRATVVFSGNTTYALGSPMNFDDILDDPNGNVSLVPKTTYTAPRSGYYIVSVQIDQTNLVTSSPILGIPISGIEVAVNNVLWRQAFNPYLSFLNAQKANSTTLISLNAGDVVSVAYQLFTVDQINGAIPIPGTVDLIGNGTEQNSFFKIHYLSSNCAPEPCQNVCHVTPHGCEPSHCFTSSCCPYTHNR